MKTEQQHTLYTYCRPTSKDLCMTNKGASRRAAFFWNCLIYLWRSNIWASKFQHSQVCSAGAWAIWCGGASGSLCFFFCFFFIISLFHPLLSESTESLPWVLPLSQLLCFLISSGFTLSTSLLCFYSNEVVAEVHLNCLQHCSVVQLVSLLILSPQTNITYFKQSDFVLYVYKVVTTSETEQSPTPSHSWQYAAVTLQWHIHSNSCICVSETGAVFFVCCEEHFIEL